MKKLKIGLIGVDEVGVTHLHKYLSMLDIEFVGISDEDSQRLKYISYKYNIKAYSYLDLLEKVNAVSVISSNENIINDCLNKKIHVLLEKPMTGSSKLLSFLRESAEKNNVILQPGLVERFNPIVDIILQSTDFCIHNTVMFERSVSSNINPIHIIDELDLCFYLFGKINEIIDESNYLFKFGNTDCFIQTNITNQNYRYCTVENDFLTGIFNFFEKTASIQHKERNCKSYINFNKTDPLFNEIRSFLCAIRNDEEAVVTPKDGVKVLKLIEELKYGYNPEKVG
uniref:Putative oxidoreductase family protein n=1 Tax=viral metagenome TaxID=1070528 RepID=A0A6M3L0T6_9ZZZZ